MSKVASRGIKARLKVCKDIWKELRSSRWAKLMSGAYLTFGFAYWLVKWGWPPLGAFTERRAPEIQALLSKRSWAIVALILLVFLVVEGAYKLKRRALRRQANRHIQETEHFRETSTALETQLADALSRPKLSGEFHDIESGFYFDETNPESPFPLPLGKQVVIGLSLTNDNPNPTTLHNFALRWEALGKIWVSPHAEEITPRKDRDIWATHEQAERNKDMVNLVSYLGHPTKQITRDVRVEGYLVFRFPGFGVASGTRAEDLPEEGWSINMTLFIEDKWHTQHPIEDRWAHLTRPSLKLSKTSTF